MQYPADLVSMGAAVSAIALAASAARRDLGVTLSVAIPTLVVFTCLVAAALFSSGVKLSGAVVFSALLTTCALIAEIDRRSHLVPNPLVLAVALLAVASPFGDPLWLQATGAVLLGLLFLGVRQGFAALRIDDALGLGDVKLAAAIGAFLGPEPGLLAVAFAGCATIAVVSLRPRPAGEAATLAGAGAPFGIGLCSRARLRRRVALVGASVKRGAQSGFSAIEALVALAIIAVALVPLTDLQTQIVRGHSRQREIREQAAMQQNALAVLRDINLMAAPDGARLIGENLTLRWRATPLSRVVRSTRAGEGDGDFNVRLYRVAVEVSGPRSAASFSVDQVGWQSIAADSRAPRVNG